MPSLNLRLTEELHAELVASAHQEHRSLQAEIVHRLETHGMLLGTVLRIPTEAGTPVEVSVPPAALAHFDASLSEGSEEEPIASDAMRQTTSVPTVKPGSGSARTKVCPHRVPVGSFCKRCD